MGDYPVAIRIAASSRYVVEIEAIEPNDMYRVRVLGKARGKAPAFPPKPPVPTLTLSAADSFSASSCSTLAAANGSNGSNGSFTMNGGSGQVIVDSMLVEIEPLPESAFDLSNSNKKQTSETAASSSSSSSSSAAADTTRSTSIDQEEDGKDNGTADNNGAASSNDTEDEDSDGGDHDDLPLKLVHASVLLYVAPPRSPTRLIILIQLGCSACFAIVISELSFPRSKYVIRFERLLLAYECTLVLEQIGSFGWLILAVCI